MAVLGINFTPLSMSRLAETMSDVAVPAGSGPRTVVTANVDHVVQLRRSPEFRAAYRDAWATTIDGAPILLYARLRGAAASGRVTGADLFGVLLKRLRPGHHRCFFIASSQEAAGLLRADMEARGFARGSLGFDVPPFGFEHDPAYARRLAQRVGDHRTTHLFVGLGAPKSELWSHAHRASLGNCQSVSG